MTNYKNNIFKINKIDILLTILSITVLLDAINGFLTMYSFGFMTFLVPGIRCVFIVFFLLLLIKNNDKYGLITLGVSIVLIVITNSVTISNELYNDNFFSILIENNIYISKLIYFFSLTVLLILLMKKRIISFDDTILVLKRNFYLMPLSIIIPTIFGLHRITYKNSGLGSSGFFISNNSTNFVMVLGTMTLLYILISESRKTKLNHFFFLISLVSLIMQGSKTSYLFVTIFFVVYSCFLLDSISFKTKIMQYNNKTKLIIFLFLCIFLVFLFDKIKGAFGIFISRQLYQIKQQNYSLISYINSGRTLLLNENIDYIKNKPLFWLTGVGLFDLKNSTGHLSEMDFFDIMFISGILGVFMTYGVIIFAIFKLIKTNYRPSIIKFYLLITLSFSLIFSFFAGHVFVDILSSTFVSLFISLTFSNIMEDNKFIELN